MGTLTVPQLVGKSDISYGILTVVTVLIGVGHSTTEPNEFASHS